MNKALCYVVSSYDVITKHYAYGGIIKNNDKKYIVEGSLNNGPFISMRNVGGEIHGIIEIIKKCVELKINDITIYTYLDFVVKLSIGRNKAKKPLILKFLKFIQENQKKMTLNFIKANKKDDIYEMKEAKAVCKDIIGS